MLKIERVTKRYGKTVANKDISFAVPQGKIAVLLGPNGAGKSTIIKCICGLLRFEGSITVDGFKNTAIEAKRRLGYVPEMPAVYDLLTVDEHLEFIARAYQLEDWEGYAQELLERLEMTDKGKKLGRELSKGMQQKLSLICAMLPKPDNLILDEPMVGLDPHAIKELRSIMISRKEAGTAFLISTHMLNSVEEYWDEAHIMMKGEFAATRYNNGDAAEAQSLEDLFFAITEGEDSSQ